MKIEFRRYASADLPAIARFNDRLAADGLEPRVGREPDGNDEPCLEHTPVISRLYVAAEGDEIRGAVWLREQMFWCGGRLQRAGWAIFPVSESLIEPRFAGVPATLIFGLLRLQPRLMALGMGGHGGPFAQLLAGARWVHSTVPLRVRFVRPGRVLRELEVLRRTAWRRIGANAIAASGLGWAANHVANALRNIGSATLPAAQRREEEAFAGWADEVWKRCRDRYDFVAVRDARALDALYPRDFSPLRRLRVTSDGRELGWVCTQAHETRDTWLESDFGALRLGIITDGFCAPADAAAVLRGGVEQLLEDEVDLIVTNQSHPAWCAGADALGFWNAPSNLAFYRAPAAERELPSGAAFHLTRSDCDGPQSS